MEFLVNSAALFPIVRVSSPPQHAGVGSILVDFGFMSHSSMDAVGTTRPCPSSLSPEKFTSILVMVLSIYNM